MNKNIYSKDDELNLALLFAPLISNFKKILQSSLLVSIMFTLISFLYPKLYTSSISFFKINDNSLSLMSNSPIDSLLGSDSQLNDRLKIDIKDVILSRRLSKEIINKRWISLNNKTMIELWELNKTGFFDNIFGENNKDNLSIAIIEEAALKEFSSRISVDENIKTGLVSVFISTEDRFLSVEILNYINTFIQEFTYQNITEISEKEILYLESRINEVDKELNVSRERLIFFLEENKNYQNSPTLLLLYNELNSELIFKEGVMTTLLQQIEIAKLNKVNIAPVIGVLDLPQIAAKKSSPSRLFFLLFGFIVGMLYQSIAVIIKSLNSNDF